ncbi:apolipoprotein N-acyltransferase [Sphingomonas changnyeongensis]|uniref:apolipoprotein N-acyltransferase n=1 Tax=Sphingomonas changnyeongensis TaxID=2698679 RepID=UPI002E17DB55
MFWPEAAIDNGYYLAEDQGLRDWLARRLGPRDLLLTGGVALEYGKGWRAVGGRNSVFVLGADGRILGRYDKAHLVPYGEYLPMRALLEPLGLSRLVPGDLDFWPGPGPASLDLPGFGRAGFQICYEIIFPGAVASRAARPDFLFNPSNDAWFGRWGPPQHLAQARLRAAEEGLPVVRATPTGISALIGPSGEVIARLPHRTMGVIDGHLPRPLPPTAFARLGNLLSLMVALVLGGLAIVSARRAR